MIYVAGFSADASGIIVPCYWKNGTRTDLKVIDATKDGGAMGIYFVSN